VRQYLKKNLLLSVWTLEELGIANCHGARVTYMGRGHSLPSIHIARLMVLTVREAIHYLPKREMTSQ